MSSRVSTDAATRAQRCCVVTGANRGLGFEFARQLVASGEFVVGTCRQSGSAGALRQVLPRDAGMVVTLDVSDEASARSAAAAVGGFRPAVDLLVNCAGVEDSAGSSGPIGRLQGDALVDVFRTNAVGAALVTQAFAELLARMGGSAEPLTPTDSVCAMLAVTRHLTLADTGSVLDHDDVLAMANAGNRGVLQGD